MKTSKNYYVPARDARTARWELGAFLGLGLAGAVLSGMVLVNALHLAEQSEGARLAGSGSGPGQEEFSRHHPDAPRTNFQPVQAATPLKPPALRPSRI